MGESLPTDVSLRLGCDLRLRDFLRIIIKSSSVTSFQVGAASCSHCWEPVEAFSELIHQIFLHGHGGSMAIGSQSQMGPNKYLKPPWNFRSVMETDTTWNVLVFAHVQVPLAALVSSVFWPLGWIKPAGPTPWVRGGGRGKTRLP